MTPRTVSMKEETRRHVAAYADACEGSRGWGIGGKMLIDGGEKTSRRKGPRRVRGLPAGARRYIAAMAALVTLTAQKKELKGRKVIWAIDNLAALVCYIDGYSRGSDVASTAEALGGMAAARWGDAVEGVQEELVECGGRPVDWRRTSPAGQRRRRGPAGTGCGPARQKRVMHDAPRESAASRKGGAQEG